eukprot:CAMPEP_0114226030 /NCGR_PEP_ID=MMETSP0058-20121206/1011_1 /TAXON_ID=36894 /ORGANISM="Pyramimonas parkeae, CCMP726" /LENGTH=144 /DNA_ID=CAMNT_0001336721 /DNA_START=56 /DNA_END=490 /DNA_ORIENTATION=+
MSMRVTTPVSWLTPWNWTIGFCQPARTEEGCDPARLLVEALGGDKRHPAPPAPPFVQTMETMDVDHVSSEGGARAAEKATRRSRVGMPPAGKSTEDHKSTSKEQSDANKVTFARVSSGVASMWGGNNVHEGHEQGDHGLARFNK